MPLKRRRAAGQEWHRENMPVRVFLDDLEGLESVMRAGGVQSLKYTVRDFEADAATELEGLGPGPCWDMVRVVGLMDPLAHGYVSVTLASFEVRAEANVAQPDLIALVAQLGETIERWRRPIIERVARFGLAAAVVGALLLVPVVVLVDSRWVLVPLVPAAVLLLWLLVAQYVYSTSRAVRFDPIRRSDRSTFWQRNRDNVVLLLMGVVIGIVPTAIVTYVATRAALN